MTELDKNSQIKTSFDKDLEEKIKQLEQGKNDETKNN